MPKRKEKLAVRKLSVHEYDDGTLRSAVGPGSGYAFMKRYFPDAVKTVRISSVFFSLKGFQLGQEHVNDQVVYHILVGRDDGHDVQEAVLNEITEEMRQPGANLTNVIKELVDRIKNEKFYIKSAKSISQPFHCKFYICDNKVGWHGSSNYANNGLRVNAEQVSLFPHPNDIRKFTSWFDNVASESEDLLGPLLKLLELWLDMASPFDVYLKALSYLLGNKEDENRPYAPVFFQQILIQAAIRQLREYGGSFIVAATGLGKTIIGSEIALDFLNSKGAKTIILIAPPLVHKKWKTQFIERGITANLFSITTPFLISKDNSDHQIDQLIRLIGRADKNTLIIIDEAHYYRNQQAYEKLRDKVSRVYQLFKPATHRGSRILLLTATVFGTTLDNLNGLLRLLPYHTIHNELHTIDGPWQVNDVSAFPLLDIVNVMSISHVLTIARKLNHIEDGQPYIKYPDKKVFLPKQLELHRVLYELPLESEVQDAFDKRFFSQRDSFHIPYFDDETGEKKKAPVNFLYKVALNSWLSSPAALTEAIEHNLATPYSTQPQLKIFPEEVSPESDEENELVTPSGAYNLPLEESLGRRKQALNPILSILSNPEVNDDKFIKLIDIIDRQHVQAKGKVLVFIRRHTTALYLFTRLSSYYKGSLHLGCTVEKLNGLIRLTSRSKRDKLLFHFSPSSFPERKKPDVSIDILICTDADGLGVDLPEADTIVNYDIPEGADVLFQRAGRILRMTIQKNRYVHFYTFVPAIFNKDISGSSCHRAVIGKFNRLIKRHQNASKVLDGDVLSDQTEFSILLNDKVIDDIEHFMKQADMSEDLLTSIKNTKLEHELVLLEHKEACKNLPGFVHSARYHQAGTYLVFLLINWSDRLWPILYNAGTKVIDLHCSELDILNRIACTSDTEKAFIPTSVVEKLCDYALEAWCDSEPEQARNVEETRKWCAMILLPKTTSHEEAMNNFARLIDANRPDKRIRKRPEKKSQKGIISLFDD
jgi:superfamily II DNA or RNA helicase